VAEHPVKTISSPSVIYVLLSKGNEFAAEEGLVAERSRSFVGGKMASLR
jgi:hypothetical protein